MQRMPCTPFQGVFNVLQLATSNGQERDVANAEAAVLNDVHFGAVGVRMHRPILPRISEADQLVHWLEHLEDQGTRGWNRTLVHEPARYARASEVFPPRHEVYFLATILDGRPTILHCESAISEDRDLVTFQVFVGAIIVHAVADVPVEVFLAGIIYDPVLCHAPRVVVQDAALDDVRGVIVQALHAQCVVAIEGVFVANYVERCHIAPKPDVRQDAILLCRPLEVLQHLLFPRPNTPIF
mmetsp:Transcript_52871/g.133567  ORF Transcript_52871/g.133567 Transcript_52871/m.133567 type:complete len:240 (-) Transcript_52871:607-1326(-)